MCGRFSVSGGMFSEMVSEEIGCEFKAEENLDLRPSQTVSTIIYVQGSVEQQDVQWGIHPNWAKKQIINAQAETVNEKKTFHHAMQNHRCLIPCSGWFEWHDEGAPRKQKYLFSHRDERPFYMAGIWFPGEPPQLVTLTTAANEICRPYHNRMPVLIPTKSAWKWLEDNITAITPLLKVGNKLPISVNAVH